MKASFSKYTLNFKTPSGTSRGVLHVKTTWIIKITKGERVGYGECGMFAGLSVDDRNDFEEKLQWACLNIKLGLDVLYDALEFYPSIQFGLEIAFKSLNSTNPYHLFPSKFTNGEDQILINGLIWMGDYSFMKKQIAEKINSGFSCLKLKIGALDFQTELKLIKNIRKQFNANILELRVDANGAFSPNQALERLKHLSDFDLHSIEQPIKAGQLEDMARLCENSPLDIALDEELIGVFGVTKKQNLIQTIKPKYIILKPTLIGGFQGSQSWINIAKENKVKFWTTSALESNIGLNAIAQWTYSKNPDIPQGLGTGGLFTNNISSPIEVKKGKLIYNPNLNWLNIF